MGTVGGERAQESDREEPDVKKVLIGLIVVIALTAVVTAIMIDRWATTPYGKLDYQVAVLLKLFAATSHPRSFSETTPAELREWFDTRHRGRLVSLHRVEERIIPAPQGEIPIRIYMPGASGVRPVIVYYHGGGWVVGNIDTHDNITRYLAKASGDIVVSVDYRLAPEHPFPAALEDAYTALRWVSRNAGSFGGDPARLSVAGDSAGGNLAAAVCLKARDLHGPRIRCQALLYPATNLFSLDTESHHHFAEGFFLTREAMEWFISLYVPNREERANPYVSPLLARNLANLPPAIVITAQFDPLRDEGEAYAEKLRQAGVPVKQIRYDGMIHGFAQFIGILKPAGGALDQVAACVNRSSGSLQD